MAGCPLSVRVGDGYWLELFSQFAVICRLCRRFSSSRRIRLPDHINGSSASRRDRADYGRSRMAEVRRGRFRMSHQCAGLLVVGVEVAVLLALPSTARAQAGPNLAIAMSHTGNFTVGQNGIYTIVVSNIGGGAASSGLIAVSDTISTSIEQNIDYPQLAFVSATGTGWSCSRNLVGGFPFDWLV